MAEMKKAVLKLDLRDEKTKQKAMKIVSGLIGVESVAMDMKDKKLTVIGDIDAVIIVYKLRKVCYTDILSVGPAKEPEKKEEPKKEEPKKEEPPKKDVVSDTAMAYNGYYPHLTQHYYVRSSVEDDPNVCVIC